MYEHISQELNPKEEKTAENVESRLWCRRDSLTRKYQYAARNAA